LLRRRDFNVEDFMQSIAQKLAVWEHPFSFSAWLGEFFDTVPRLFIGAIGGAIANGLIAGGCS
jgi:hypothetical protein